MDTFNSTEAVYEQLNRLATSETLSRSKRLLRFLRFTVENALAKTTDLVTEHTIASEVYERAQGFDPSVDGIVRAEAHRLRAKLAEYYCTAGRQDPIIIDYPLGSYIPTFRPREIDFLPPDSRNADFIRFHNWANTALGPLPNWPRTLQNALAMTLRCSLPMAIFWGPEFIALPNDAASALVGEDLSGRPLSEAPGRWQPIESVLREVWTTGKSETFNHELWLVQHRGYQEERYFTCSYSPIPDGETTGGVLNVIHETSDSTIGERRLRTLYDLTGQAFKVTDEESSWRVAASVLSANPYDIPFASLYVFEDSRTIGLLRETIGVEPETNVSHTIMNLDGSGLSPVAAAAASGRCQVLKADQTSGYLPHGAWQIPPREVVVLPVQATHDAKPLGFLIAGINPHMSLDNQYRMFLDSLVNRIADLIVHGRLTAARRVDGSPAQLPEHRERSRIGVNWFARAGAGYAAKPSGFWPTCCSS